MEGDFGQGCVRLKHGRGPLKLWLILRLETRGWKFKLYHYPKLGEKSERNLATNRWAANEGEEAQIAFVAKVRVFGERRGWGHAPPELLRAA